MIDWARIAAEAKLDGKYLLSTSDPHPTPAQVALVYKNLLEAGRGFRDMESTLLLRPVIHRPDRSLRLGNPGGDRVAQEPGPECSSGLTCAAFLVTALIAPRLWPWYALPSLTLAPFALAVVRRAAITMSLSVLAIYVLRPHVGMPGWASASQALVGTMLVLLVLGANWRSRRISLPPTL